MSNNYIINGTMTYMPEELETALLDRAHMIEAGQRTFRRLQPELFSVTAHVRDQDGNSLLSCDERH